MLSTGLLAILMAAAAPEMMIPEGTILPVVLNETLDTARVQENDPVLFTLAEDIRAAGRRGPVLLPRGSSVVGRIVMTDRAGRLVGRSSMEIRLQEIITPTGEVYDGVSTKIVDVAKMKGQKAVVKADGALQGPGHAKRDTFFLLFPPTTVFQLMATPKRGPDVVLPIETRLQVKLMSPIWVETQTKVTSLAEPVNAPVPVAAAPVPVPVPVPALPASQLQPVALQPVSGNHLENLVAPVALYPDAILRDLFRATARPFEMMQANLWVHQVRDVNGSLPLSGYNASWDPSVKALTAYPELLQRLTSDAEWMGKLGSTYVAQPIDVLNAVQRVRVRSQSVKNAAAIF
jgi:hypothetical protein